MDIFTYAGKVRLRSAAHHAKYLAADSSSNGAVFQARGSNKHDDPSTVWEVKRFRDSQATQIRLRSSYGGYLTGSHQNFLLGWTGKKVVQTNPTKADDLCEWEPIQDLAKHGTLIKLRTRYGTYLRANGGAPPWRNTITHDFDRDDDENFLWEVEIVQERDYSDIQF
ncbi:uncharacterized protein LOC112347788 [Selaginella moellendorffii]|uniref:uncharacterized protein LOC112347788 n=1 Tax=Selaginella moellendorffii TaxID=88036 RepID=UPI000D1CF7A5|nr:uncharacterized protein LOC112347788 [Selaginella moellendorffii]|eukprot:XP_024534968.1 uncharacterized protein LOC112347788 [Selaginella moellendorffii]